MRVCSKSILYQKIEEFNSIPELEWEKTYCGSLMGFWISGACENHKEGE